jgi:hypothetical protein
MASKKQSSVNEAGQNQHESEGIAVETASSPKESKEAFWKRIAAQAQIARALLPFLPSPE